ncbi:MAG: hypothetical protein ABWY13_07180 [Mesorhizobium sp.]
MPEPKLLRFPNGREITSDMIRRLNVYPGISSSLMLPYVQVFGADGLIYEGLVDLDRIEVCGALPTERTDAPQVRTKTLQSVR